MPAAVGPDAARGWREALVEALARRAEAADGRLNAWLQARRCEAEAALAAHRHAQHKRVAAERVSLYAALRARHPAAAAEIAPLRDAGDLPALQRLGARLDGHARLQPLLALRARLDTPPTGADATAPAVATAAVATPAVATPAVAAPADAAPAAPAELKAWRNHRETWVRLDTERQLRQALAALPEQAGPLHSQRLVLRALQEMQVIAPAYLAAFLAQAETWVWLDEAASALRADGPVPRRSEARPRPAGGAEGSRARRRP